MSQDVADTTELCVAELITHALGDRRGSERDQRRSTSRFASRVG